MTKPGKSIFCEILVKRHFSLEGAKERLLCKKWPAGVYDLTMK